MEAGQSRVSSSLTGPGISRIVPGEAVTKPRQPAASIPFQDARRALFQGIKVPSGDFDFLSPPCAALFPFALALTERQKHASAGVARGYSDSVGMVAVAPSLRRPWFLLGPAATERGAFIEIHLTSPRIGGLCEGYVKPARFFLYKSETYDGTWRRRRDSNPRRVLPLARFPGV